MGKKAHLRPEIGEGTSLRESRIRQEQDCGIFHGYEVKKLMIPVAEQRLKQMGFACRARKVVAAAVGTRPPAVDGLRGKRTAFLGSLHALTGAATTDLPRSNLPLGSP